MWLAVHFALLLSLHHVHAATSSATTQLVPSSLFQMSLGPVSSSLDDSTSAIEASISSVLLESSTDGSLLEMTVVVQSIMDTNGGKQNMTMDFPTTTLRFACIATFQGSNVETESLDDFIIQTFSTSSSIKRFKKLLRSSNEPALETISGVGVSLVDDDGDSSSRYKLTSIDIAMVVVSASILLGILWMIRLHRKDAAQEQDRAVAGSFPRRRTASNDEKEKDDRTPDAKSPPHRLRSTDFVLDNPPTSCGFPNEEVGSVAGSSGSFLSEAFSSNWFRSPKAQTDSSVDDSLGDVFQVDVEGATRARLEQQKQEEEDQMLGATTVLMDWARYIQVIRTDDTKLDDDSKLELEMVSTQSTDLPVESSFEELSVEEIKVSSHSTDLPGDSSFEELSMEETSASESETGTEHPFEEVGV